MGCSLVTQYPLSVLSPLKGVMDSDEFEMLGPRFLFNIEAGAGTKVNYGPWVHRQRYACTCVHKFVLFMCVHVYISIIT